MPVAKPQPEPDLSLLDAGDTAADTVETARLYQKELATFDSPDLESDEEHERKIRRRFQVKQLEQFEGIIESRKKYASKIFLLVVWWLIGLGVVVLLSGWKICGFALEKAVLLALIGGTTLNVLGIFTIVTNFLFPKGGNTLLPLNDVLGPLKPQTKTVIGRRKSSSTPEASEAPPTGK
ncbi:hypothetical protein AVKW3434_07530 [Acidovorax sp. SUPP3434]|uniref:hypothetical protein n=1 Tax=Acidovorax sp. SUPP3434 TaxID=2920880 RepID=UPI0023DE3F93|nr:hypothetical protein [Acidovorax sp. SUPP3434]GKS99216.1 hypothetical protein AVKW3434_07530 [Acidovorax sp. SUPP3434]